MLFCRFMERTGQHLDRNGLSCCKAEYIYCRNLNNVQNVGMRLIDKICAAATCRYFEVTPRQETVDGTQLEAALPDVQRPDGKIKAGSA
jgi:hypothetical protein